MSQKETEKRVATGVYVRTSKRDVQSIRIEFCYRKILCRETLKLKPIIKNISRAIGFREKVIESISLGNFNYAEFFPGSKSAIKFGHVSKYLLIAELLNQFLVEAKQRLQFSTYDRYERVCKKHLIPVFGKMLIKDLNAGVIWDWLNKFSCQRKTLVNILTPLRAVVSEALIYGHIEQDPFSLIDLKRLNKVKSTYIVNPFNQQEIQVLLSVAEGQVKNLVQFAFFTGLRTSELIGLRWEDIDWESSIARVRRALVNGKVKNTKTPSGMRSVHLFQSALQALHDQKKAYVFIERLHFS